MVPACERLGDWDPYVGLGDIDAVGTAPVGALRRILERGLLDSEGRALKGLKGSEEGEKAEPPGVGRRREVAGLL